ncbi:helix-turn-helix domain-containing protein [Enterococcus sp. LJL98]
MEIKDILNSIGSSIREIRLKRGITQQELADKADLSLPFINLIENNKRQLSLESLLKLLEALDVSPSEFFNPYSQDNKKSSELLMLLEKTTYKDEYIEMFIKLLTLSLD